MRLSSSKEIRLHPSQCASIALRLGPGKAEVERCWNTGWETCFRSWKPNAYSSRELDTSLPRQRPPSGRRPDGVGTGECQGLLGARCCGGPHNMPQYWSEALSTLANHSPQRDFSAPTAPGYRVGQLGGPSWNTVAGGREILLQRQGAERGEENAEWRGKARKKPKA